MRYSWYNYSTYDRLTEFNSLLRKREILRNTEDLRNKFIIDIIKYNLKYQYLTMNMIHNIIILP